MSDAASGNENLNAWFLDSGATHHMTNEAQNFSNKQDYKEESKVLIGNGSALLITHIGSNFIYSSSVNDHLILNDILHIPNINKNLLSISQFTNYNNVTLEFDSTCCVVKDKKTRQVLLRGTLLNGLYQLHVLHSKYVLSTSNSSFESVSDSSLSLPSNNVVCHSTAYNCTTTSNPVLPKLNASSIWHCRLRHPSHPVLNKVMSIVWPTMKCNSSLFCDACQYGKLHHFSFKQSINTSSQPFDLVFSDVWGPAIHPSLDGYRYYVSYVDDYTRFTWVHPIQTKSQVLNTFRVFKSLH